MSEHLPYDDELKKRLEDIPLPSEDAAWEDMKRRLEDDDDDRPLVPPPPFGCGRYGLLLLVAGIALLIIINPFKWFHRGTTDTHTTNHVTKVSQKRRDSIIHKPISKEHYISEKDQTVITEGKSDTGTLFTARPVNKRFPGEMIVSKNNPPLKFTKTNSGNPVSKNTNKYMEIKEDNSKSDTLAIKEDHTINPGMPGDSIEKIADTARPHQMADSLNQKSSVKKDNVKNEKRHRFYFGAGLSLQQLLPVTGQKTNPYNALGRKSFWGDYIPAVYARLYSDKKWFVQSAFRYGAPQYTKDVVYIPKKIIDTSATTITYSSSRVEKTFYNEIPISINYFISPNLSAGVGISINTFHSALIQRDIHFNNRINQSDTITSSSLLSQKKSDSNFVKTYLQALIEAEYKWKRFSFGAKFSFGLQPYLRFTLPGGKQGEEKNSSLQLFIRYELWTNRKEK